MLEFLSFEQRCARHALQYKQGFPLSFWLADMDIAPPRVLLQTIEEQWDGGFGYGYPCEEYFSAIRAWFQRQFSCDLSEKSITYSPSVLYSLKSMVELAGVSESELLFMEPYYPGYCKLFDFQKIIRFPVQGTIDFAAFARVVVEKKVKAVVLCHPHNPIGRVFSQEELQQLVSICAAADIWLFSDEIHMDFSYVNFTPLLSFEYEKLVSFHSIGKTFNVSGIMGSYAIFQSTEVCQKFQQKMELQGIANPNMAHIFLTIKAYQECERWLEDVKQLILENLRMVKSRLDSHYSFSIPMGMYLIWVNYAALEISEETLAQLLAENGMKVALGSTFGCEKEKCFRLNLACSKEKLARGIDALNAVTSHLFVES